MDGKKRTRQNENRRFSGFLLYLKEQKRASENTIQSYLGDAAGLDGFLGFESDWDYQKADLPAVQRYFDCLREQGLSPSTAMRRRASLGCYYDYLIRLGVVSENLPRQTEVSPRQAKTPAVLTPRQIDRLLSAPQGDSFKSRRDRAILETLYACGLRVSELLALDAQDVNLQLGFLHVRGPSPRDLPLYPSTIQPIRDYLNAGRPSVAGEQSGDALFLNSAGGRLSRQAVWKLLKDYARQAGLGEVSPQQLRHSLAVHLLQNGASLEEVQAMLGHSDIASTQVYARLFQQTLREKYRNIHPRGRQ